ncbi:MAG TPA: hypothetical protein VMI56_08945 [Reyranella sp.]|nr:hypothetical protein [Reyranella sp.]
MAFRIALWVAFCGLVAAAGWMLLRACALSFVIARVWSFCPAEPPPLSAEADHGRELRRQVAALEVKLAEKARQCAGIPKPPPPPLELPKAAGKPRVQQTAALKPPPPPPPPKPKGDLDADRWNKKDIRLLEGCWRLGHNAMAGRYDAATGQTLEDGCTVFAGQLCFDGSGNGSRGMSMTCPSGNNFECHATLAARFTDDGRITMEQPRAPLGCNGNTHWDGYSLNCRRVDENTASCDLLQHKPQGPAPWDEPMEFRR